MQDSRKAVWSILYVSVASFFPSLKQNFIAYRSSKCPHCIFEIDQLWQSGFMEDQIRSIAHKFRHIYTQIKTSFIEQKFNHINRWVFLKNIILSDEFKMH